ncbi:MULTISPECIES: FtsX-like permease family protein [Paenibacillus]|uniref:ABC transporter permease protein YxdM n=1 Tax=Paenibacillus albilobatus TaxID=2716884 RepID=A0A919XEY1_9BACL|nr:MULTISPECIES: ABC transporter permease [Paenibacillus]GIO29360.1 ABC transporter permease protein YxdM [Paenibacillus albilobatus]
MSFRRFAFNNVKRNARAYFAYFLSSCFMVMVFFTYALFIFHPDIDKTELGSNVKMVMLIMEYVIYTFAFLFVLYSIGSFLKARNKEFGILTMLGATQGQLSKLVFVENMIIGALAIVAGILAGLLLSKLFLTLSARMIGIDELGLYFPAKALLLTVGAFLLLFLVISAFTLLFINQSRVLELLKGGSKPKKEPKVSIWISLFGVLLLAAGYVTVDKNLAVAAATGIAGTYFFFTQITVLVFRMLKKSRRLTWRGTNLIWISEMAYKIKDNAVILFMVTVVTAICCMAVAFVMSINVRTQNMYHEDPYPFRYYVGDAAQGESGLKTVEQKLNEKGITYEKFKTESYMATASGRKGGVAVMSEESYKSIADALGLEKIDALKGKQAVLVQSEKEARNNPGWSAGTAIELNNPSSRLEVVKEIRTKKDVSPVSGTNLLVVSPDLYDGLIKRIPADRSYWIYPIYIYMVPSWSGETPPGRNDQEYKVGLELDQWAHERNVSGESVDLLSSRGGMYAMHEQGTAMMSFIGIFIASLLSVCSASFLYFKLHSELRQDQQMYTAMSKIGLQSGEMGKSSTVQIAVLFFTPIFVSAIQTLVVLNRVREGFDLDDVNQPVLLASAAFLIVQAVYFVLVSSRYIQKLKRVMV